MEKYACFRAAGVKLRVREIGALPIIVPPIQLQSQISQFLDKKTSQIDSLIEKIERKIELLKEQRTALISQCVTKGLNPNVEMKVSGVEWIGEVPINWERSSLKYSMIILMGQSPSSENCNYDQIGKPFLQGCKEFGLHAPNSAEQFCITPPRISPKGAILMSVRAPVGKLNLADQEYGIGRGLCAFVQIQNKSHIGYFYYLLNSLVHRLNAVSVGSTYDAVSVREIGALPIIVPPIQLQSQISQFLDKKTSQIDSLSEKLRRKIELLKEYRQSLISNVVTGKVKVTEDAS